MAVVSISKLRIFVSINYAAQNYDRPVFENSTRVGQHSIFIAITRKTRTE